MLYGIIKMEVEALMRVISGTARGSILHSIENINTRPTLDRVKESLFNIIQNKIPDAVVLDLFAGSGALAIEALSRGAQKAYLCDYSKEAIQMINKNLEKTRLIEKTKIYNTDYMETLKRIEKENVKFDIIFLDPPYKLDLSIKAIEQISKSKLLNEEGIIIIETDEPKRDLEELDKSKLDYNMYDLRKYGRASLIFLTERGT
jgi:RNA methyltransferase, rsmD family